MHLHLQLSTITIKIGWDKEAEVPNLKKKEYSPQYRDSGNKEQSECLTQICNCNSYLVCSLYSMHFSHCMLLVNDKNKQTNSELPRAENKNK